MKHAWMILLFAVTAPSSTLAEFRDIAPLMQRYCLGCHDQATSSGGINLASLRMRAVRNSYDVAKDAATWEKVLLQLERGEMPPHEEEQPTDIQRATLIRSVENQLLDYHRSIASHQPSLRRMNAFEYRNTIRDLIHVDVSLWDPSEFFPDDEIPRVFDNNAEALITSDYLLKESLAAASAAIERAVAPADRPGKIHLVHSPPAPHRKQNVLTEQAWEHVSQDYQVMFLHGYRNLGTYVTIPGADKDGVPYSGRYRIKLIVSYHGHPAPYDEVVHDARQAPAISINVTPRGYGLPTRQTDREVALAELTFAGDGKKHTLTFEHWLDAGWIPRFEWINGPTSAPKFNDAPKYFPGRAIYQDKSTLSNSAKGDYIRRMTRFLVSDYRGPTVRIHHLEIDGPHFDTWPPRSHTALLGDDTWQSVDADALLTRFAKRAFRRSLVHGEIAPIVSMVNRLTDKGIDRETALRNGLRAILTSPQFLYLPPVTDKDEYALASRLSYFLWSSMPDKKLLAAAASGSLRKPDELRAQTERLLNDSKSSAFVRHFTSQWLELYKIGTMPPDENSFGRVYHLQSLDQHMVQETQLFFQHMLENNLSVLNFIDSDFTFINRPLAELYGIEGVDSREFRRMKLQDKRRGGLLGQASVLTASANGIDTSPVIRGKWVLENLLGRPPGPPPAVVPAIEPDIRGTVTIRDQLAAHREGDACAGCHKRIDPYGFALESFNPVGGWRKEKRWDTSGSTYDGQHFADIVDLKKILLKHHAASVVRCVTEKLLAYATGRSMRFTDRPDIKQIVDSIMKNESGLRELIYLVVQSSVFHE